MAWGKLLALRPVSASDATFDIRTDDVHLGESMLLAIATFNLENLFTRYARLDDPLADNASRVKRFSR